MECEHKDTYFERNDILSLDDYEVIISGNLVCEDCGELVSDREVRTYERI